MKTNAVIACEPGMPLFSPISRPNGASINTSHRSRHRSRIQPTPGSVLHAANPRRIPGRRTFQRIFGRKKAPLAFGTGLAERAFPKKIDDSQSNQAPGPWGSTAGITIDFQKDGRLSQLMWQDFVPEKVQPAGGSMWSEWQYLLEDVLPGKSIDEALQSILGLQERQRLKNVRAWQTELNGHLRQMAHLIRTGKVPSPKLAFLQSYLELNLLAVRSLAVQEQG